jgi:hypothetical protein
MEVKFKQPFRRKSMNQHLKKESLQWEKRLSHLHAKQGKTGMQGQASESQLL